ncbi:DUF4342 domain-containing protein [Chloroflexota bacterium]
MSAKNRFTVAGKDLVERIKQLTGQGDTREICLIHEEKRLLEIPLSIGDPASPANVLAALNAFATLVTECTVEVEKADNGQKE